MKTKSNLALRLFFASTLLSTCFAVHASLRDEEDGVWAFVDTKSGASGFLSREDRRFVLAEEGKSANFCPTHSPYHCFRSADIEFAVPKKIDSSKFWSYDGRTYCVVQRFDDFYSRDSKGSAYLIFSKRKGSCDDGTPFDMNIMFSESSGLRQIEYQSPDGSKYIDLVSIDRKGFGAS